MTITMPNATGCAALVVIFIKKNFLSNDLLFLHFINWKWSGREQNTQVILSNLVTNMHNYNVTLSFSTRKNFTKAYKCVVFYLNPCCDTVMNWCQVSTCCCAVIG